MLISGCAATRPPFMQDHMVNQFFEKEVYPDQNASYIGEWTGATPLGLTSIKIIGNGKVKMCASNEYFGSLNGKVFKEEGSVKMIFESGAQYEIVSQGDNHILVTAYDQTTKYYSGNVPDSCKKTFGKFI